MRNIVNERDEKRQTIKDIKSLSVCVCVCDVFVA